MDILARILGTCGGVQKASDLDPIEEDASEIQLNAFEFRNYRTTLEAPQHKLVERVVNQWCAVLVKGKKMMVNGIEDRVLMDKDLLGLEWDNEYYPLKEMSRMEMFKDPENLNEQVPFSIEMTFRLKVTLGEPRRVVHGETELRFNFEHEHQRLNFALALRILRTRDPTLDTSQPLEVLARDDDDLDDEGTSLGKLVNTYRYNVDAGIPVVFSVNDLKIYKELQSTSRLVYVEFFVRYPRQDKFLYAKSPTTPIPQKALMTEDAALRRKKANKEQADQSENKRRPDGGKKKDNEVDGPKESMTFDLKNVKLKVPKVPHTIFGRLMAKDEYFPTAIGTFDFEIKKSHLQDRRKEFRDENTRREPEQLSIPMLSTWKMPVRKGKEDFAKIGLLTLRLIGYITDPVHEDDPSSGRKGSVGDGSPRNVGEEEEEEEEEEDGVNEEESEEEADESP